MAKTDDGRNRGSEQNVLGNSGEAFLRRHRNPRPAVGEEKALGG